MSLLGIIASSITGNLGLSVDILVIAGGGGGGLGRTGISNCVGGGGAGGLRSTVTATAPELRAQYSAASCIKVATDTWYVVGDIA